MTSSGFEGTILSQRRFFDFPLIKVIKLLDEKLKVKLWVAGHAYDPSRNVALFPRAVSVFCAQERGPPRLPAHPQRVADHAAPKVRQGKSGK